jgi:hypothetical protein
MITRVRQNTKERECGAYVPFQPHSGWLLRPFRVSNRKVLLPGTKIVAVMMPNSRWHLTENYGTRTATATPFATACTLNIDFVLETE